MFSLLRVRVRAAVFVETFREHWSGEQNDGIVDIKKNAMLQVQMDLKKHEKKIKTNKMSHLVDDRVAFALKGGTIYGIYGRSVVLTLKCISFHGNGVL